jgi:hypothetical protein
MNELKKGVLGILPETVIEIILIVIFAVFLFVFVGLQKNAAGIWGDIYAKDIAQVVNLAKPGDEISIDIQHASEIAKKNNVPDLKKIIWFDNESREIVVKLSPSAGETRFSYFNDVEITNNVIELGIPGNVLRFKVKAAGKEKTGGEYA